MQRLGAGGFLRALGRLSRTIQPHCREVLLFVSVVITVAGSVAFLGLHLQKLNEERQGMQLGRMGEPDGLPDVLGNRCLDQPPKRL